MRLHVLGLSYVVSLTYHYRIQSVVPSPLARGTEIIIGTARCHDCTSRGIPFHPDVSSGGVCRRHEFWATFAIGRDFTAVRCDTRCRYILFLAFSTQEQVPPVSCGGFPLYGGIVRYGRLPLGSFHGTD